MNVSNLTIVNQQGSSVVKPNREVAANKPPASSGKVLPEPGQVHLPVENSQKEDSSQQPSTEALHDLVAQANGTSLARSSNLKFSVAEGTDISVIRIEDAETGELIRQIPSEAMVAIARALDEQKQGMMLQEEV